MLVMSKRYKVFPLIFFITTVMFTTWSAVPVCSLKAYAATDSFASPATTVATLPGDNETILTTKTALNENITFAQDKENSFSVKSDGNAVLRLSFDSSSQKTYIRLYTPSNTQATNIDKINAIEGKWSVNQWGTVALTRSGEKARCVLEYKLAKGTYTLKVTGATDSQCSVKAELLTEQPREYTEKAYASLNGGFEDPCYFRHDHSNHF